MNTISENLQRLVNAKANIANAITAKGGTVHSGDGFEEFPADIASIPVGGGNSRIANNKLRIGQPNTNDWQGSATWTYTSISGTFAGGSHVWSDGYDIYCSYNGDNKVFNRKKRGWSEKVWNGLTNFDGKYVWSNGTYVFYSKGSTQYVLDRTTSTWSVISWGGLTSFNGDQLILCKSSVYSITGTTSNPRVYYLSGSNWNNYGLISFPSSYTNLNFSYVWGDGNRLYYSDGSTQWVASTYISSWSSKTWSGLTSFYGDQVWSDGINIYYSSGSTQYMLNPINSTWSAKSWSDFSKSDLWTDGVDIYCSKNSITRRLTYSN